MVVKFSCIAGGGTYISGEFALMLGEASRLSNGYSGALLGCKG